MVESPGDPNSSRPAPGKPAQSLAILRKPSARLRFPTMPAHTRCPVDGRRFDPQTPNRTRRALGQAQGAFHPTPAHYRRLRTSPVASAVITGRQREFAQCIDGVLQRSRLHVTPSRLRTTQCSLEPVKLFTSNPTFAGCCRCWPAPAPAERRQMRCPIDSMPTHRNGARGCASAQTTAE